MLPTDDMPELPVESELDVLKQRAAVIGVTFHPSISLEKLRAKVNAKLSGEKQEAADEAADSTSTSTPEQTPAAAKEPTAMEKRRALKNEMMALVRVKISCLNPAKKEWEGEIITVGNAMIPSMKKFVPFSTTDDGYHLPKMMLDQLRERQCQIFVTKKDDKGNAVRKSKLIKEFAIEVLPPLTKAELAELAQRQALSRATDD